jgi:type IV pilus assembly protein PilW
MNPNIVRRHKAELGMTIVELMISMALGLVILGVISVLFVNTNRHQVELDKSNRLIDNGRYATELISEALRSAGFYGEFSPGDLDAPLVLPDPCKVTAGVADLTEIQNGFPFHVQGYDAADDTATASIASSTCVLSGLRSGSDVIVVRRAAATSIAVGAITTANTVYVQGSHCIVDSPTYKIERVAANLDRRAKGTDPNGCGSGPAPAFRYLTDIYYVASDNLSGDGIPTLKRVSLNESGTFGTPEPLVEGIEYMQIQWGADGTTEDGVPESWETCAGTSCDSDWHTMVSAKIYILARSADSSRDVVDTRTYQLGTDSAFSFTPTGTGRNFRRHVYTSTVRLTNAAIRRELP